MAYVKRNRGRGKPITPLTEEHLQMIESYAERQATNKEIGAALGVCERTIEYWRVRRPMYSEVYERGRQRGCLSLRSAMFETAIVDKNPTMQIWLSKQILGMREPKTELEHSGPNGGAIPLSLSLLDAVDVDISAVDINTDEPETHTEADSGSAEN